MSRTPRIARLSSCILSLVLGWVVEGSLLLAGEGPAGGDWPMWRYDAGHTAASPHELPPQLHLQWTRQEAAREPVWDDPLNRDVMPYDRAFEPVVAGGRMFLSFNDADKVVALDVRDGSVLWTFYADGPVRFSPVVYQDSVLFTSDDGHLYCVAASSGDLRWRFRGGPSDRKVLGNRRVISSWPARGGPVVADGTVYFAASIWPFMGTFLYALDVATGEVRWRNDGTGDVFQRQPHNAPSFAGVAPQGQLAVAGDLLLVPGGRCLPAALDRASGKLKFFNFGGKGQGGSFVAADPSRAFVHTRVRGTMALRLPAGSDGKFRVNEPVLSGAMLYAAAGRQTKGTVKAARIEAYDAANRPVWQVNVDGTGDLIQAGRRLYAAGAQTLTAVDLPTADSPARIAWSLPITGEVVRLVAAAERLFAVTLDGRILAFGPRPVAPAATIASQPQPLAPGPEARQAAEKLLEAAGGKEGYALWFGVDDEALLEAVVAISQLHVVVVDPGARKIGMLRRRLDRAGLYGRRVAAAMNTAGPFCAPPYVANLVVVGRAQAAALAEAGELRRVYESVRPYGGKLWIAGGAQPDPTSSKPLALEQLPQSKLTAFGGGTLVSREGALPGSADWTHAYGDVANTVKSNDSRVKLPLGLLWFGSVSNVDVLPRHGHGPSEQVVDGRLFIEGLDCFSARDVYTGRVLWKRAFKDLDTLRVYYDESYADKPLETSTNQVHIPGANARGTNFVATPEGVYLVARDRCVLLDAATGRTLREFVLPPDAAGKPTNWGYVGVYQDLLLAGTGFADYTGRLSYRFLPTKSRGFAWGPDRSASLGLLAFDRRSGKILWRVDAAHGFLHNAIAAGGGRIYLLDKLPKRVEEQVRALAAQERRPVAPYRLLALDAQTGKPRWTSPDVFGTWLSYSEQHDLVLQAGAAASDRSPDEVDKGMAVYRATDGSMLWRRPDLTYAGPCILHGDSVITNTTSYRESKGALRLLDGSPVTIPDPVTGDPAPWRFARTYGCNTAVASQCLLTFRSGAAGFYDLEHHGGTGNLGGFKSGCTSNLIVADGVLNAPDYTRTCTCGYQNQTSLALVPMPENEFWTYNLFAQSTGKPTETLAPPTTTAKTSGESDDEEDATAKTAAKAAEKKTGAAGKAGEKATAKAGTKKAADKSSEKSPEKPPKVRRIGINLGAPGDRLAEDGTLWINYPPDLGTSPKVAVELKGELRWFRVHSGRIAGEGLAWVAASGVEGVRRMTVQLAPAEGTKPVAARNFTVRLHFAEPDERAGSGTRRFDVSIQGKPVLAAFDVVAEAGGPLRPVVRTFPDVTAGQTLEITLSPRSQQEPVLCGVEVLQAR